MFWLYRQHAASQLYPRSKRKLGGPILGLYSLIHLYTDWTCFTLKQIRTAFFPGATLTISILPYRSPSAQSSHSGRWERKMRGNINRQWVEWGWSSVRVWSRGRRQLWHISRMKVNGTEDLQDNAKSVETEPQGETHREGRKLLHKDNSDSVRSRRMTCWNVTQSSV